MKTLNILFYNISCYIKSYHIKLHNIILYHIILYYIILYYIILYYIISYYIISWYIISHYNILYHISNDIIINALPSIAIAVHTTAATATAKIVTTSTLTRFLFNHLCRSSLSSVGVVSWFVWANRCSPNGTTGKSTTYTWNGNLITWKTSLARGILTIHSMHVF